MRLEQVHESLKLATNYSLDEVTENGYWCAEVHSNTTFTAGMYILEGTLPSSGILTVSHSRCSVVKRH